MKSIDTDKPPVLAGLTACKGGAAREVSSPPWRGERPDRKHCPHPAAITARRSRCG